MGCAGSTQTRPEMGKSERSLKAALLIQRWYRRYQARLEARRRCTWSIFQSIEYAGEQDQLKLYNFFNDMMSTVGKSGDFSKYIVEQPTDESKQTEEISKDSNADKKRIIAFSEIEIEDSYKGPHVTFPLSLENVQDLLNAFEEGHLLHAKYALQILSESLRILREMPNISRASTAFAKQITVCGDLHGKMDDLLMIFYKNGLPGPENPYIFNGDYVDRGKNSVEIALTLFAFLILYPNEMYLNRGNHEDYVMNLRYGFLREVQTKYSMVKYTQLVLSMFQEVFSWLPLATVIDAKVMVTHGGISDQTDLTRLDNLPRYKYHSILKPPLKENATESMDVSEKVDLVEWRQILDALWSDPRMQDGCQPNAFRGGGSYFGPDITKKVLAKHGLDLLIRSHECKPMGYEFTHDDMVLTIFSASNYYEVGSNRGAYVKMGVDLKPHCIQFIASEHHQKLPMSQRVSIVEGSALRDLKEKIISYKTQLREAFLDHDPDNTGFITPLQWATTMENIVGLAIPWHTLRPRLVSSSDDNKLVKYETCLDTNLVYRGEDNATDDGPGVTETLYRNRSALETIFRIIDKDHSGSLSLEEFEDACSILSKHIGTEISKQNVKDMATSMDINKDGLIDFNEFLEAFRLVDPESQQGLVKSQENGNGATATADEKGTLT
ncbi:serine/threonine-protein phosphatase with EF-hands 2-like isoform X2 [Apostichopus japonicus]|uniref:serine/threonine-protein phosphatase with EF-hands 2-like isoform X2 n=1 Tax=Stichopus japonicus TaxID=307972 RepID=UPI003AB6F274